MKQLKNTGSGQLAEKSRSVANDGHKGALSLPASVLPVNKADIVQRLEARAAKNLVPAATVWSTISAREKHKATAGATAEEAIEKLKKRPDGGLINTIIDISDEDGKTEIETFLLAASSAEKSELEKPAALSKPYPAATAFVDRKHRTKMPGVANAAKVHVAPATATLRFSLGTEQTGKGRDKRTVPKLQLYHLESITPAPPAWDIADDERVRLWNAKNIIDAARALLTPFFPGIGDMTRLDAYLNERNETQLNQIDLGAMAAETVTAADLGYNLTQMRAKVRAAIAGVGPRVTARAQVLAVFPEVDALDGLPAYLEKTPLQARLNKIREDFNALGDAVTTASLEFDLDAMITAADTKRKKLAEKYAKKKKKAV